MKKYKTPMFKPHMLKAGRLLVESQFNTLQEPSSQSRMKVEDLEVEEFKWGK